MRQAARQHPQALELLRVLQLLPQISLFLLRATLLRDVVAEADRLLDAISVLQRRHRRLPPGPAQDLELELRRLPLLEHQAKRLVVPGVKVLAHERVRVRSHDLLQGEARSDPVDVRHDATPVVRDDEVGRVLEDRRELLVRADQGAGRRVLLRRLDGLNQHADYRAVNVEHGIEGRLKVQEARGQLDVFLGLERLLGLDDPLDPGADPGGNRRNDLEDRATEDLIARQSEVLATGIIDLEDGSVAIDVGQAEAARPEEGPQPLAVQIEASIVLGHWGASIVMGFAPRVW
jgi:hypothetical protein